jgi:ubiquinone/menaquinone biosynthesis C-methylase UbiE
MPEPLNRDPQVRFSDRVDDYVSARPHYPEAVVSTLAEAMGTAGPWSVADVGSGTGIFSELLLKHGHKVFAIEPNAPMRAAAEQLLAHFPGFASVPGSAEATTLPDRSVDLVTAAQAFHWFDPEAARREFVRILRPHGLFAAIWNTRRTVTPFEQAYEALISRYGTDYHLVGHRHRQAAELLLGFFAANGYEPVVLSNHQLLDAAGLTGRLLSSSYIPRQDEPGHADMMRELHQLFDQFQEDGRVRIDYDTEIHMGRLS